MSRLSHRQWPLLSWPFAAIPASFFFWLLLLGATWRTVADSKNRLCDPNGQPNANYAFENLRKPGNPLLISSFQIDLAVYEFSFAGAKAFDVIFDLIVGRGGQLLLGWYGYHIVADTLIHTMQKQPVSYDMFSGLFFQGVSFQSLWQLVLHRLGTRKWKKRRTFALAFVMAYIIAFPTLVSAVTGYTTSWIPYVTAKDGRLAPLSDYVDALYLIRDGSRVGLGDYFPVGGYNGLRNAVDNCEYNIPLFVSFLSH